jgi:branched-chain amino acid transport system permease protein
MKPGAKSMLLVAIGLSLLASKFSHSINDYFLDVTIGVGISITLAVSLNLVNGFTGQFSLGHAGFMAVGAYTAAFITTVLGNRMLGQAGLAGNSIATGGLFVAALLGGGLLAAAAGLLVGVPSLRLRGDYLAIVTLGFGEIIRVLFQNMDAVGAARGFTGIPSHTNLFWTFAIAAVATYVVSTLVNSTYGRGFLAVRDDEVAAEAMGINTTKYKVLAFVIGAFFAGIAGGLYAHFKQFINPDGFNFMRSIEIVVMVILGGMGNTIGVILAAILLTVLPELLRAFSAYRMIIYSLLLIILMLACPQGLFRPRVWIDLWGWAKRRLGWAERAPR